MCAFCSESISGNGALRWFSVDCGGAGCTPEDENTMCSEIKCIKHPARMYPEDATQEEINGMNSFELQIYRIGSERGAALRMTFNRRIRGCEMGADSENIWINYCPFCGEKLTHDVLQKPFDELPNIKFKYEWK